MRDQLFQYYVEFGHNLCYLRAYLISARRISNLYSGIMMIASCVGIANLSIWKNNPVFWACITVVAQILQTLQPLTQASQQRQALKYILQDAEPLFDEITNYWNTVGVSDPPAQSDDEISAKITDIKQRYRASENKFASEIDFPGKWWLEKKAKKENTKYFWYHYRVRVEEEF